MKGRTSKTADENWSAALRLFSGRRNPEWDLNPECIEAIREKIAVSRGKQAVSPVVKMPQSGYRGIRVSITGGNYRPRQVDLFQAMLVDSRAGCLSTDADDVARKIYHSMPKDQRKIVDGASYDALHVADDELSRIEGIEAVPIGLACHGAPEYVGDTGVFKDFRLENNCYNYGINQHVENRDDTAMPGGFHQISTPGRFIEAFRSDHLTLISETMLEERCPPPGSHYVAVVLRHKAAGTRGDFHVLRLDSNGRWSHKDNDDPVTPLDGNLAPIVDLKTALFEWPSKLLGFFRVPHNLEVTKGGHVKK